MVADVVWLDQARDDVHQYLDYLYPKNPSAALEYIEEIEQGCAGLANFPLQGMRYDEGYRTLVIRNHLVCIAL